ncbi:MAG: glycosyltransferase [Sphingobacteriales bacterium]|nr:glycosyltransferase [Sphingobacteriales bacterium]
MFKKDYVLVLPSWYPSRVNEFNGDFNQRTIEALSSKFHQVVIYLVADKNLKKLEIQRRENNQITTIIGYYPKSRFKWISFLRYFFNYLKITNYEIKNRGIPIYIHTYVFFPAGLISLYFSKKLQVKSVLTEHWTAFYNFDQNSLSSRFFLLKYLFKKILSSFHLILPVAKALELEMKKWNNKASYKVIPNVVNTDKFNLADANKYDEFTFLHVSTLSYQKNPEMLLDAFVDFLILNPKVKLNIIGPENSHLKEKVENSASLKNAVKFLGEMEHHFVADEMKRCHVFVLNSRFENLPCVILEALCCGLPVISTDVGGVSEILNEENGVLFTEGKKDELIQSLYRFYQSYKKYHLATISESAIRKYNFQTIADETWGTLKTNNICS